MVDYVQVYCSKSPCFSATKLTYNFDFTNP